MRLLLIHPTHRRFIRLLRERVANSPFYLTREDLNSFRKLIDRTKNSYEIHQGIYRIFIIAINRPHSEVPSSGLMVNSTGVDLIEKQIRAAERKHPGRLLTGLVIIPLLSNIIKWLKKGKSKRRPRVKG